MSLSFIWEISSESKKYFQEVNGCKNQIIFNKVDFQHQLSHIIATNSFFLISKSIQFKTGISTQFSKKYDFLRFSRFIIFSFIIL